MKGLLLKLLRAGADLKLYHYPVTFLEASNSASVFSKEKYRLHPLKKK